jgi:hypothetical protein
MPPAPNSGGNAPCPQYASVNGIVRANAIRPYIRGKCMDNGANSLQNPNQGRMPFAPTLGGNAPCRQYALVKASQSPPELGDLGAISKSPRIGGFRGLLPQNWGI